MKAKLSHWVLALAAMGVIGAVAPRSFAEDKVTLKVVKADSEETSAEDGKAANAVDGDANTIWHTEYENNSPNVPHEITIELSAATKIKGVTYLPRQDEGVNGTVKDYEIFVSADGKDFVSVKKGTFGEGMDKKTVEFDATDAKAFKLKAISEINGEVWTSAAEIGIVPAAGAAAAPAAGAAAAVDTKGALKVVKADSEETSAEDGKAANAFDGDPSTIWHTEYENNSPNVPHEIIAELTKPGKIKGFTYLPRQDEGVNGTIKDYEFFVSEDGKDFKSVKKGTFGEGQDKKSVDFDATDAKFIKLKAISEINGEVWTSVAEITVIRAD